MQSHIVDELIERSALKLELEQPTVPRSLDAAPAVRCEIDAMRAEDKILLLTEEEERMLRSFRGFKGRTKTGGVFKWQTRRDDAVVVAPRAALITDPQDVSLVNE